MSYNLLESQKEALRWIVKKVQAGKLPEEGIPFSWTRDGLSIPSHDVDPPDIKRETFKALRDERLLHVNVQDKGLYFVSLTPEAYEAVDQMGQ